MITCPNINLPEWGKLVDSVGETKAYGLWSVYKGDVLEKYYTKVEQSQPIQSVKEGVDFVFEQNPELASIGSPEQYSKYLDSMGITDIAYHHSEEDISEFTSSSERYFQKELKKKGRYIPKLDDIVFLVKKPLSEEFMSKRKFIGSWGLKTPKTLQFNAGEKVGEGVHPGIDEGIFAGIEGNYDAVDFGRIRDNKTWSEVIAITNPNNAIKLGSKQDVEGFKEFVNKQDLDSSFRSMEVPNTNLRNLEKKLGFVKQDGTPVTFKTMADAQAAIKDKITDEYRQQYNFTIKPAIGYKRLNGVSVKSYDFFRIELENKYRSTIIDNVYGEIDRDDAAQQIGTLFTENTNNSQPVIESLLESDLIDNDIKELLQTMSDIDVSVTFVENNSTTLMDTDGTVIRINKIALGNAHPKLVAEGFVHELIHIKTVNGIENPQTQAEKFLSARVKYVFNKVKNSDTEGRYGFKDESEFVAELMAKKEFRNYVKGLENGTWWQKLINAIAEFFGIDKGSTKLIKQIEDFIENGNPTVKQFTSKRIEVDSKTKETLNKIINNLDTRVKHLKKSIIVQQRETESDTEFETRRLTLEKPIENNLKILEAIEDLYEKAKYVDGITSYIDMMGKLADEFEGAITTIREDLKGDNNKVFNNGKRIRSLGNFIVGNLNNIDVINSNIRQIESENPELKDTIRDLKTKMDALQGELKRKLNDYKDFSTLVVGKFLLPFGLGRELNKIVDILTTPGKDISWMGRWINNLQDSYREALGMIDAAVKNYYNEASIESKDFEKKIVKLGKKLEEKDINDTKFMIAKDKRTGKNTHYFVTEVDIEEYRRQEAELRKTLEDVSKLTDLKQIELATDRNKKKWKAWYKKNKVTTVKANELNDNTLLKEKLAELGAERYKLWKSANLIYNPKADTYTIPHTRNSQYKDIMSNSDKAEFYWAVLSDKAKFEAHLHPKDRHLRRLPQMRKDIVEMAKNGNWDNVRDAIKSSVNITSDDTEFGDVHAEYRLKDERGNPIKFIPVFYVSKLEDPQNISEDIVSSMIAYGYDKIKRSKLALIVDLLELGKDVIHDTGVAKTSSKGNILKSLRKSTKDTYEEAYVEHDSKMYDRLVDYINMYIYGESKVEGKSVLGMNSEKLLDLAGKYTAFSKLAGNIYSGISSITVGEVTAAIEALQGKFFSVADRAYAEKVMFRDMAGLTKDIGARLPKHKLTLWIEYMDVLNNFEEQVHNMDFIRKTRASQLMKTDIVFATSRLGEVRLHSEVSLSAASSYRFNKSTGRWQYKNEFFKELETLKNKRTDEIRALDSKAVTKTEIDSIKDKYNEQTKALETKLNAEWEAMTKYYDAFDAADGELVIKPEFNNKNTKEDRVKFIAIQQKINTNIQGAYAKLNKAAITRHALGRLAMMFRGFIPPAIGRRFAEQHTDFELGMDIEGYYNTTWRFITGMFNDIKDHELNMYKSWNILKDEEKSAVKRSVGDFVFMISMYALLSVMKGFDDDDDQEAWAYNMSIYQINRLAAEYGAFAPPFAAKEFLKIMNSPLAATNTVQELYNTGNLILTPWNWGDEIEAGKYKGLNRLQRAGIKTIPMTETVYSWFYPEEKMKYWMINN